MVRPRGVVVEQCERNPGHTLIRFESGHTISLRLRPDCPSADLIYVLNDAFENPNADKWPIISELAYAGVFWPSWADFHDNRRDQYEAILGDRPRYRDLNYRNDDDRRKAMWERYELPKNIKGYTPAEVSYPEFFEADYIDPSRMLNDLPSIPSTQAFLEYFQKARTWWRLQPRVSMPHPDFIQSELKASQLLMTGHDIPPEVRLIALSAAQIRECIRKVGLPKNVKALSILALSEFAVNNSGELLEALADIFDPTDYFAYMPPKTLTWRQFQDIRLHVKGQAIALLDISWGMVDQGSLQLLFDEKS